MLYSENCEKSIDGIDRLIFLLKYFKFEKFKEVYYERRQDNVKINVILNYYRAKFHNNKKHFID